MNIFNILGALATGSIGTILCVNVILTFGTLLGPTKENEISTRLALSKVFAAFSSLIACVANVCMAYDIGTLDMGDGRVYFLTRWVDWLLSTPLLVLSIAMVGFVDWPRVTVAVIADILMIITGALSAAIEETAPKYALFGLGTFFFIITSGSIVTSVKQTYPHTKNAGGATETCLALASRLAVLTFVTWCFYPAMTLLGPEYTGIIDADASGIFSLILDLFSKVLFGILLVGTRLKFEATMSGASLSGYLVQKLGSSLRRLSNSSKKDAVTRVGSYSDSPLGPSSSSSLDV